jgi:hypothetical protein
VKALVDWLKKQGFKIGKVTKGGTSVYARARVDQIEKSLGVEMVRVTKDELTFTAARNAPSLAAPSERPRCGIHTPEAPSRLGSARNSSWRRGSLNARLS